MFSWKAQLGRCAGVAWGNIDGGGKTLRANGVMEVDVREACEWW